MDSGIRVGDIMTRDFVFATPDTDLRSCVKLMVKKKVGSLIIKKNDKLVGLLTEKIILWAIVKKSKRHLREILASDVMKKKVFTIKPSADIMDAVTRFRKKKVRRLPVVERGRVIGMLTQNDVLKIDPELFGVVSESVQIREETEKLRRSGESSSGETGICDGCGQYEILVEEDGEMICDRCSEKR